MVYPSFEQYNNAFQAYQQLLADPELQQGTIAKSGMGTPLAISGGFALTYTIKSGSKKYAVRCFHRESKALERRYQAISRRLNQLRSPYFLKFEFQPKGIRVDGSAYPVVKMAWAQGVTLGEYLEDNHGQNGALTNLPASLLTLSKFLEAEHIAHGDIQTGNMMVAGASGAIQLIDYDGMFVEEIRDLGSAELGHINFQHPDRKTRNPFGPTMDRFSLIALSVALKALHEDPTLWRKTNSEMDAILFRANDFLDPVSSPVFAEIKNNPALADHVQHFAAVCKTTIDKIPSLEDFLAGRNIPVISIQISSAPSKSDKPKVAYLGVYKVLDATNFQACHARVGDKVEVVGRIVEVKQGNARNGNPYIFINFGPWKGMIFKVSIWSEGLAAISKKPDASWVGKWVSVIGLMEPPYVNRKYHYSHLSINVTANGQVTVITEAEAKFRLASANSVKGISAVHSNREALDKIKGRASSVPSIGTSSQVTSSPNQSVLNNIRKAQGKTQVSSQQVHQPKTKPPEKGFFRKLFNRLFG